MKTNFVSPTLIALAIAGAVALGSRIQAAETTAVAPASSSGLPDDIQPGTPAAQVVKLVQAGVDASVIQTYVTDCRSAFNLDADKIIALTDAGVPGDLINAMIAHDKNFLASLPTAEQPATASTEPPPETNTADTTATPEASVPPEPVTVNYFYNTLNPYGSWVNVEGYGLCWRPTVVVYDSGWRPYCDRGHWVYTDCGWYWDSDYAWGATFHYGRWFNSPRYGWCWWPDTVWAPSWVTWRSSTDYCGWAPLPPFSVYQPGIGFTYRGKNVSVGFGFGLASSCFTFVSASHFCEPHPRYYCVPQHEVVQIYNRSAVCNNYDWHNHFIVNNGVSVTVIGSATRHPIQPVSIGSLVNVHRHGWHGESVRHQEHPFSTSNSNGSETRHFTATGRDHNPVFHRENSENGTREHVERHETFNTHSPAANHRDEQNDRGHGSGAENPSNHRDQHDQRFVNGNQNNSAQSWQHATAPDNNNHNRVTYVPSSQNNQ
ncbi:MAG TPA: DUF6600 domain-containing protein, partial [Candidatus Binatia bacterium]|nr:DUF6600 domain-containing protein [Candidatus Binatia bacterium]